MTNLFVNYNNTNNNHSSNTINNNSSNSSNSSLSSYVSADVGCDGYPIRVCLPSSVLVGATGISFRVGGIGTNCCITDSGPLYSNIVTIPVNGA